MPSLIGTTSGGVSVAANYLRVLPSPGAALTGVANGAPLMTFNTPNLQLFSVAVTGEDLTATPEAANSSWSKVIRAIQVTSEVFAVFAPEFDTITEGGSTFCYLAPDFNTNPGATTGDAVTGTTTYSIVEQAIVDAVGGTCVVNKVALTGLTVA
jgi:hypothetical protein